MQGKEEPDKIYPQHTEAGRSAVLKGRAANFVETADFNSGIGIDKQCLPEAGREVQKW